MVLPLKCLGSDNLPLYFSGVFVVKWPMIGILSAVFRDPIVHGCSDLSVSRSNILSILWSVWG